jgi:hypothetical protein
MLTATVDQGARQGKSHEAKSHRKQKVTPGNFTLKLGSSRYTVSLEGENDGTLANPNLFLPLLFNTN